MRTVTIEVEEVKAETELAFLFVINGEESWVPKSQVEDADDIEKGFSGIEVEVAEWFAEKEGLV